MRSSRKPDSRTVLARISTGPNNELRLSLRVVRPRRKLPAAGDSQDRDRGGWRGRRRRRGGRRDGRGDARDEGVSGDRSRVLAGLRSRVLLLLRFLVRRNQAGPSSSDRQRDTSPSCFRESRFPSTGDWRRQPAAQERHSQDAGLESSLPLRLSRHLRPLWPRLFRTMNRSLRVPVPRRLPKGRIEQHDDSRYPQPDHAERRRFGSLDLGGLEP